MLLLQSLNLIFVSSKAFWKRVILIGPDRTISIRQVKEDDQEEGKWCYMLRGRKVSGRKNRFCRDVF